jgi:Z1 domain-containing protein
MPRRRVADPGDQELVEIVKTVARNAGRWQPTVGNETLELLRSLQLPEKSQQRIADETVRILSQCVPPTTPEGRETGLVIGYVQSGKTISFTTVAALARDNRYQMVIVITGTSVPLLNQSTDRLIRDLRLNTRRDRKWQHFKNPSSEGNVTTNIVNTLADWDDETVPQEDRRTILITVMKNVIHLDNLVELLRNLPMNGRPVIVIDDEADQAGLNTGVRRGRESATYQRLLKMREALPHHSYLQYTATPQAPLLINLIDALSPRFHQLLVPGEDYTGGHDFFVATPGLIRTIPESEIPSVTNVLDGPPESLLQSLRIFFLGVAAGFVRDRGYGNRSMLVHPSQRTYDHGQYAQWVRAVTEQWLGTLSLSDSDPDRQELLGDFREAYLDLSSTVPDLPTFEELTQPLKRAVRQTRIEEVNTRVGETPGIPWNATYPHILVGGQAMDRGFTIEGLTVTYMPRGLGVGNADNVQQRARFFGYKRPYLGYCRVFLENRARDAYQSYVVHEEDIRGRLAAYAKTGRPLIEWKREFFLKSTLKPTRRSVLGLDYMRMEFGEEWWSPAAPHESAEAINDNRKLVDKFLSERSLSPDRGSSARTDIQRHLVDEHVSLSKAFEGLLTEYRLPAPEDSQRLTALLILIQDFLEEHPDEECSVYVMSGGAIRKRGLDENGDIKNLFQGPNPDRTGAIYPGDRQIRNGIGLTIQVHRLSLEDESGKEIANDVPVLAIWVPAEMGHDLVVQDQPLPI